jgi:hypothetical protein
MFLEEVAPAVVFFRAVVEKFSEAKSAHESTSEAKYNKLQQDQFSPQRHGDAEENRITIAPISVVCVHQW